MSQVKIVKGAVNLPVQEEIGPYAREPFQPEVFVQAQVEAEGDGRFCVHVRLDAEVAKTGEADAAIGAHARFKDIHLKRDIETRLVGLAEASIGVVLRVR